MNDYPEIQNTEFRKLLIVKKSIRHLEESLRSLEWGRMLAFKNERIDEMIEECAILIKNLLECKDKEK